MLGKLMIAACCLAAPAAMAFAQAEPAAKAPAAAAMAFAQAEPAAKAPAAAAQSARDPAFLFGIRESVHDVAINPSGTRMAYIGPGSGSASILYLVDLDRPGAQPQAITRASGNPDRLSWCNFVSDTRLVCQIYALQALPSGVLTPFTRLFAIDADGGNIRQLGQRSTMEDTRLRQFDGAVIDWLPGEPGTVLMSREHISTATTAGTRVNTRREDGLAVELVNTINGRSSRVERPNTSASSYMTDGRGKVRVLASRSIRGETGLHGSRTDYFYRTPTSAEWRPFGSYDWLSDEGMRPIAVDADLNVAYALKKLNGRLALYRVKLDGSMATELVHANERVDVDGVVRASTGSRVIGVTLTEDKRDVVYFDREYEQLSKALGQALPNTPKIYFAGGSADAQRLLIFAAADNEPGRYYVFDKPTMNLAEIMLVRPDLEHVRLANQRWVSYRAADGTTIPAYLTLPPGREARGLPAVVLPHGGPSARDEWGFDWLGQYLANQGYAVLQPQYRGSAGFGDAWLQRNGFQGWETSIGDVIAGARWLASEGIADPNRLGIVGWSYGGYAALQAAVVDPDLFKAVVAIAPVTDLQQLKDDQRDYTNFRTTAEFIGTGPHIRQGSPLQNVGRINAPVLLVHGDRDLNVRVIHSQRMDRELRSAGKQSELVLFPGLEHDLDDTAARTTMLSKIGQLLGRTIGR